MATADTPSGRTGSLVFKDDGGNYFEVPIARLDEFRMPDDQVEAFLKSQTPPETGAGTAPGGPAPTNFARAAGVPSTFLRATPTNFARAAMASGFVRAAPTSFARAATPSGLVRVVPTSLARVAGPSSLVRVAPTGFARVVPSSLVRVVPSSLVRVVPSNLVRVAPCGTGAGQQAAGSGKIVQSWLKNQ